MAGISVQGYAYTPVGLVLSSVLESMGSDWGAAGCVFVLELERISKGLPGLCAGGGNRKQSGVKDNMILASIQSFELANQNEIAPMATSYSHNDSSRGVWGKT